MAVAIRMPDFGTAVTEVRILKRLVEEGQAVTRGALLAEVETDKAASDLECVAEGVLLKVCVPAGAAAVTKSNTEIPHLRLAVTIDMSEVERLRAAGHAHRHGGGQRRRSAAACRSGRGQQGSSRFAGRGRNASGAGAPGRSAA